MICWPGPGMMKWRIPKVCLEDIRGFKVVFEFQVTVWTAFCTATKYNSTRNLLQHCWDVHYEDPLRCGFSVNSINWSMVSALSALSNFTNRLHDLHTVRWSLVLERVLTWKHKLCTIVDHTLWKAMSSKVSISPEIYLPSLMVHLATFHHLVMKTDNGAYGNAEFHSLCKKSARGQKCSKKAKESS